MVGAAGTGKSTVAAQFVRAAADRGQPSAIFLFDESPQTLLSRSAALNIDLSGAVDAGLVAIRQVDPAELTPANSSTPSGSRWRTARGSWSSTA